MKKIIIAITVILLIILSIVLITTITKDEIKEYIDITFDSNGGTTVETQTIVKGSTATKPTNPIKSNYSFVYWEFNENEFDFNTILSEDTTLTAKWNIDDLDTETLYSITYNLNGGINNKNNPNSCTSNDVIVLNAASRTGYIFEGWYIEDTFINKVITLENINEDLTLYAKWIVIGEDSNVEEYKITYILDGGTNDSVNPIKCTSNDVIVLNAATKDGYIFRGWYIEDTFINKVITLENIEEDLTLYAKWDIIDANEYTITYVLDNGINDPNNPLSFFNGDNIVLKEATKEGYTFSGWYSNRVGGTKIEVIDSSYSENISLFARWVVTTYEITYELYGGVNSINNPTIYTIETEITLETPTRLTDTFLGWNVNGVFYETFTFNKITGNLTIVAVWQADTYVIIYELNGGYNNSLNPKTYSVDDGDIELYQPTKVNYELGYWSLTEDGLTKVTHLTYDLLLNYSSIILYAFYIENDLNLNIKLEKDYYGVDRYYLEYGNYPQTVEEDINIINELNKLSSTNDNGYYEYNGSEYAKEVTNLYYLYGYTYKWNSGIVVENNKEYYFKVEPIKWRIIQNDGVLQVLSDCILDTIKYHSTSEFREIDNVTIYSSNYEHSEIRYFLNNSFYNNAFSVSEQYFIATTEVYNGVSTTDKDWNRYVCNDTYDKIYLLSYKDLITTSYGFSDDKTAVDNSRSSLNSDYALAKGCAVSTAYSVNFGVYWTRSPNASHYDYVCSLSANGVLTSSSFTGNTYLGIRPMFTFN